jgi:hypothetical protein
MSLKILVNRIEITFSQYFLSHLFSHPNTNYLQALTQLLKKLQDKLAGGNRRDPFTALPLEIAILILQCFSFKQIV